VRTSVVRKLLSEAVTKGLFSGSSFFSADNGMQTAGVSPPVAFRIGSSVFRYSGREIANHFGCSHRLGQSRLTGDPDADSFIRKKAHP